jgi:hypothetical protein
MAQVSRKVAVQEAPPLPHLVLAHALLTAPRAYLVA